MGDSMNFYLDEMSQVWLKKEEAADLIYVCVVIIIITNKVISLKNINNNKN